MSENDQESLAKISFGAALAFSLGLATLTSSVSLVTGFVAGRSVVLLDSPLSDTTQERSSIEPDVRQPVATLGKPDSRTDHNDQLGNEFEKSTPHAVEPARVQPLLTKSNDTKQTYENTKRVQIATRLQTSNNARFETSFDGKVVTMTLTQSTFGMPLVEQLQDLRQLEIRLTYQSTFGSDTVALLARLTQLHRLSLPYKSLTWNQYATLQEQLPNTQIEFVKRLNAQGIEIK